MEKERDPIDNELRKLAGDQFRASLPDNYFEKLPYHVTNRVHQNRKATPVFRLKPALITLSSLSALLFAILYFNRENPNPETLSNLNNSQTIEEYAMNYEMDDLLFSHELPDEVFEAGFTEDFINDDEISDYLLFEDIEISLLESELNTEI